MSRTNNGSFLVPSAIDSLPVLVWKNVHTDTQHAVVCQTADEAERQRDVVLTLGHEVVFFGDGFALCK